MSDEQFADGPPAGAEGWREVWNADRRFRPRPSKHEWFLRILRRLFRRAAEPDTERQKDYNLVLLDLLGDLRRDLAGLRDDFKRDVESVQHDVRRADEGLAAEIAAIRELIPVAARRNDALIAALDQKIETVAVRVRDVTNVALERAGDGERRAGSGDPRFANDFLYRRLEDGLRGSEAEVRASVHDYVSMARAPLLDVGCGRGELLAACKEAGIDARGFDTNERSVADLRGRGLEASVAGVPECFAGIAAGSIGTVVAMHVVEHLPVEALFALFAQASRVLQRDGLLILETPNAESLAVSAGDFWRDPTHLAPRHPAALTLLAREHGFSIDDIRPIHPFPEGARFATNDDDAPSLRRLIESLNDRFFSGQDLRLIARRL
jgi:2-polyprenyl-3-methyl-5-hydroxy-6-metoxy-1,4-benzoquinol methylase